MLSFSPFANAILEFPNPWKGNEKIKIKPKRKHQDNAKVVFSKLFFIILKFIGCEISIKLGLMKCAFPNDHLHKTVVGWFKNQSTFFYEVFEFFMVFGF